MDSDDADETSRGGSSADETSRGRLLADGGEEAAALDGRVTDDRRSRGGPYDLRLAWAEHRPHVLFATAIFALGAVAGIALALADVDLLAQIGLENPEELFEGVEFTATSIFVNNTTAFLLMVVGAVSLGLLTVLSLLFNGLLVGWLGALVAGEVGVDYVLVLLAPHGILELPALFVAAGVGFRLVHLGANYLRGTRDRYLSSVELRRTLTLLFVAWIALAVAAVIEVYVTPAIAEAIFGGVEADPV